MGNNKYHNIKTKTFSGKVYDSRKEARRSAELNLLQRAGELNLLQRAGEIKDLREQVKFVLIPTQYETVERYSKTGKRLKDGQILIEKECSYYADFVYIDVKTGNTVVEDTKGVRTEAYKIKRKLMLQVHGIRIKEID
ncbi:MAG: DUF1064 domain-containing protein [Clostridia bacterium]|nr:DUF1064 domain-containing protein [Clostridia bacterium]